MRHQHYIEGAAFRLRPIGDEDAEYVVELRAEAERTRYLNRVPQCIQLQMDWLKSYYLRENDFYFVIERKTDCCRQGLISLYDIDGSSREGEWGRWIVSPTSMAAIESVLLLLDFAFGTMSLSKVYAHTSASNASVVSFHDTIGFPRAANPLRRILISGEEAVAIRHECTASDWNQIRPRLALMARRIAQKISDHDTRG